MSQTLQGKVALVTGGSRGIGKACVERLQAEGAKVATLDIKENGVGNIVPDLEIIGSVANELQVLQAVEQIMSTFGRIDILVNNAGMKRDATWKNIKSSDLKLVYEVNFEGQVTVARAVLPHMIALGGGHIVNLASIIALFGNLGQIGYGSSKASVVNFTEALAQEVARKGIYVNAVAPGFTATEILEGVPLEQLEFIVSRTPLGRLMDPSEQAEAVVFLAKTTSITGHTLVVDGGLSVSPLYFFPVKLAVASA